MSTHNIDFYEDLTKIIFELISSNTHLISSAEAVNISQVQSLHHALGHRTNIYTNKFSMT